MGVRVLGLGFGGLGFRVWVFQGYRLCFVCFRVRFRVRGFRV